MLRQLLCTLAIAITSSSPLFSADWTSFRGPDGNSKSPDTGLLKKWDAGGPKLLWCIDSIGMGYSNVAISGGRIYINGNAEERSMVFCFDKDGKEIWRKENGPAHTGRWPGTRGTLTIDGDDVYDISPLGETACFDAKTGDKKWSRNILKDYGVKLPMWHLGYAVVTVGDNVISPLGGPHCAIAMDKKTGKTTWEAPPAVGNAETAYTTPYLFDFEEIRVVVVMSNVTVEGLDSNTGKRLFTIPWTNSRSCHCTMPVYHDGHLFLTTGYEGRSQLFKLAKNPDGTIKPTEVWTEPRFDNQHGGVVLVGDHVYGTSHKGQWCSINFMTGEVGYIVGGVGSGSVHYADGMIYGLTEKNKTVLLIKPEPKEFSVVSRFELPNDADGMSWAHPVVLDGRLYLRHAQYLYCYEVK